MFQTILHYFLHLLFPGILAFIFFGSIWKKAWGIMILTILVDIDHLLANPIFDPARCSIGFHPLHSYFAIAIYIFLLLVPNIYIKIIAFGLVFHMMTDFQDCLWMR